MTQSPRRLHWLTSTVAPVVLLWWLSIQKIGVQEVDVHVKAKILRAVFAMQSGSWMPELSFPSPDSGTTKCVCVCVYMCMCKYVVYESVCLCMNVFVGMLDMHGRNVDRIAFTHTTSVSSISKNKQTSCNSLTAMMTIAGIPRHTLAVLVNH
jgi:hypothetical protein